MRSGLLQERTRVSIFLPTRWQNQKVAYFAVLEYLKTQRRAKPAVEGYTTSDPRESMYQGEWWNPTKAVDGDWDGDYVSHLIIDYDAPKGECEEAISKLRSEIMRLYEDEGSKQEEIWIIAYRSSRYISEVERPAAKADNKEPQGSNSKPPAT